MLRTELTAYRPIADAIAGLFGPDVELHLRDARSGEIIHVANARGAPVAGAVKQPAGGGLSPFVLRKVLDFIAANLHRTLHIKDVAQVAHLSPKHFARAFTQSTGTPPRKWLIRRRVEAACSMLGGTNKPLAEIAIDCGFADQSHFTVSFRRVFGMSPGRWRQLAVTPGV